MEIERLKELKNEVSKSNIKVTGIGYLADMQDLINAEIARKSVKSEEVQEAIEELQYGGWQSSKDGYPITLGDKTIDLAITALQQYQQWIPVSDCIPTESELRNGMVLAWSTELDEWQVENWGYVEDRPDDYTHWMTLPEPPKGE